MSFEYTPHSDKPEDQLVTETISSWTLQSIAGLIIKLGELATEHFAEDDPDYDMGQVIKLLGKVFGDQVYSQSDAVDAVDTDKVITFVVPVGCVSRVCRILTDALNMGKIPVSMHEAWTPFAEKALSITPGGPAMLRKAKFRMDNPEHPGLRADLN
jgi:hypothetical protein